MILYPAIDLKDGKCVRLYKGDMNQVTIFNQDPVDQAKIFEDQGFKFLHIVDLDGAVNGKSINNKAIESIINNVNISIQLGGGIRNIESIERWLNLGISKVIVGTIALTKPDIVKQACNKFPGKIIVGLDAKDNMIATEGWMQDSNINLIDLAKSFENIGVDSIIYTDINRDGTMQGPNINNTVKLAKELNISIIASGGVSSFADILNLKKFENEGIAGIILGRALYENKIDLSKLKETIL